jgi:hypothetical protein
MAANEWNEIYIRRQSQFDGIPVTRRDILHLEAKLPINRRHCVLPKTGPYNRYFHDALLLCIHYRRSQGVGRPGD